MPRFYLSNPLVAQSSFRLPENIVRHIHVLRLRVGAPIVLFNGDGREYPAVLTHILKREAYCEIGLPVDSGCESPLNITLIQAVSMGDRMDFTIQKSVELGVSAIRPIMSARCQVRLSDERAEKRMQRWQEIVIAACEQSGRNIVPPVLPMLNFMDYLAQIRHNECLLMMSLNRAKTLANLQPASNHIHMMIGPEGGWTIDEENAAIDAGFHAFTLGKRVLRTETAALAALAAMQTLWGDLA